MIRKRISFALSLLLMLNFIPGCQSSEDPPLQVLKNQYENLPQSSAAVSKSNLESIRPKRKPSCEALGEMMVRCIDGYSDPAVVDLRCKGGDSVISEFLGCSSESTCAAFVLCTKKQRENKKAFEETFRVENRITRIREHVKRKEFKQADELCKMFPSTAPAGIKDICMDVVRSLTKEIHASLISKRDAGPTERNISLCRTYVELVGKDPLGKKDEAQLLCAELNASYWLAAAKKSTAERLNALSVVTPFECTAAAREIEKVRSEWARKAAEEIKATCANYPQRLLKTFTDKWNTERDIAETDLMKVSCYPLTFIRPKLTVDAQEQVDQVCAEVAGEKVARRALESVQEQLKKTSPLLPYNCIRAPKELSKADSAWMNGRLKTVMTACHDTLGRVIIEKNPPKRFLACPFALRRWFNEASKHSATNKSIAGLLDQVRGRCSN